MWKRIISILIVAVSVVASSRGQDAPKIPDRQKAALEALQGEWELTDDRLFFDASVLTDKMENDLPFSPKVRVKGDRFIFGEKEDKEVEIRLGELGERMLIGFVVDDHHTVVGIYELDKERLKVCVVGKGIPAKCGRTRGGIYACYERVKK